MNRMRCKPSDGKAWTTVRVRELHERLRIAPFDPQANRVETISVDETASRLEICIGSVQTLIREGLLPATQLLPSTPWQVPVAALETEAVKTGVRKIVARRLRNYRVLQDDKSSNCQGSARKDALCHTTPVTIVDEKARWLPLPAATRNDLPACPFGRRMPRRLDVENFPVGVINNEEHIKRLKEDRPHAEEVASPNRRRVLLEEGAPTRRRLPSHGRRTHFPVLRARDPETKPCQLRLDPPLAPSAILCRHAPNEIS